MFDRRIQMDDHNVIKIVNATCVLHNYLCTARMDVANIIVHLNPDGAPYLQPQAMLHDLKNQGYHSTRAAQRVRRTYKDYFNSELGAVPWQHNNIGHHENSPLEVIKLCIFIVLLYLYCHWSLWTWLSVLVPGTAGCMGTVGFCPSSYLLFCLHTLLMISSSSSIKSIISLLDSTDLILTAIVAIARLR